MANTAQSKKRAKQGEKRRLHNMGLKSRMRTAIKKVIKAIKEGKKTEAQEAYKAATPILDSMVSKKFIHKNKAARHKSRLNDHIRDLQS